MSAEQDLTRADAESHSNNLPLLEAIGRMMLDDKCNHFDAVEIPRGVLNRFDGDRYSAAALGALTRVPATPQEPPGTGESRRGVPLFLLDEAPAIPSYRQSTGAARCGNCEFFDPYVESCLWFASLARPDGVCDYHRPASFPVRESTFGPGTAVTYRGKEYVVLAADDYDRHVLISTSDIDDPVAYNVPAADLQRTNNNPRFTGPKGASLAAIYAKVRSELSTQPAWRMALSPVVTEASDVSEVAPPGFSGTVKSMIDKHGMEPSKAFALAWWMYKRGRKPRKKPEPDAKGVKRYLRPETYAKRRAARLAAESSERDEWRAERVGA